MFFLFLFVPFQSIGQVENDTLIKKLINEVVYTLADDNLHGRMPGTVDEVNSLKYIERKMDSIGCNPFFKQEFSFKKFGFPMIKATNGYVFINNKSKKTVLISAHYDHIGYGNGLSTKFKENDIHNGADDNASGVALIIALYDELLVKGRKDINYLFVFYSGHEMGLFGSEYFSKLINKNKKFKEIKAVLNFDMVGRMDNDLKLLKCFSNEEARLILEKQNDHDLNLKIENEDQLQLLDTNPFLNKNKACFSFTTGIHLDYHSPDDDAKYINVLGIYRIHKFCFTLINSAQF